MCVPLRHNSIFTSSHLFKLVFLLVITSDRNALMMQRSLRAHVFFLYLVSMQSTIDTQLHSR